MASQADSSNAPQPQTFVDPLNGKRYERTTFSDDIRGPDAKPIDFTLAKLAQDVYRSHERERAPVDGWTALSDQQLRQVGIDPKLMSDKKSGFDAAVYTDNDGRYVVAFRGTDQTRDWKTNLGQGLGFQTTQYNLAAQLGTQAKAAFGENVVFTGHSLGGGLTTAAILAADGNGAIFNSAGLTDKSIKRLGLEPKAVREQMEDGTIRNYQVKSEILTHVQEKAFPLKYAMADAVGRDMPLPDPAPLKGLHNVNPFEKLPHRLELHGMDSVLTAWQMKHGALLTQGPNNDLGQATHPANGRFETAHAQLGPQLQAMGLNADQARNVSADLTLQSLRDGNTPARFTIGGDAQRAFAVPAQESSAYSSVGIAESKDKSFAAISQEASRVALANPGLIAANPGVQPAPGRDASGSGQEPPTADTGGQSVARR